MTVNDPSWFGLIQDRFSLANSPPIGILMNQLTFTAWDPIWYDPDADDGNTDVIVDENLIFPITFPISASGPRA